MSYHAHMHRSQLPRTGLALGGIGTGWFEIRQDGGFHQWQIFNNWPLFTGARYPYNEKQSLFFVLRIQLEHENPRLLLLQIEDAHDSAAIERHEFHYMFPWLSGVDSIRYSASVPFADLDFEHEDIPLKIHLRAWSPFIPGNVKDSNLPLAYFDFEVESTSDRPMEVELIASARNAVGYDQPNRCYAHRRIRDGAFSAVVMKNDQLDPEAQTTGTVCLASFHPDSTAYMGWEHHHPYYERLLREAILPEVDDTEGRNHVDKETGNRKADPRCFVSIARAVSLPGRGSRLSHSFAYTWHFPNLYGRLVKDDPHYKTDEPCGHDQLEGHLYVNAFESAEAVARYAHEQAKRLLEDTMDFHRCFFDSDLPACILDQINSHLNTFRTSTWLTQTGMFGVLEGLSPFKPFAGIATTDVAMYGQIATSLLFPELDRMTVDTWRKFQDPEKGIVVHSITCNSRILPEGEANGHRLDMPAQFVFQSLRAGLWSQDPEYLRELWPAAKAALAYVLRERDANQDLLPDMAGIMCSYDNFPMYGVAPYVVSQWLAAVALALKVAWKLEDHTFISDYTPVVEQGGARLSDTTWNGSYFNLYSDHQPRDPEGEKGCMVDQLIGEGLCPQVNLPPVVDPEKTLSALRHIMAMNYKSSQGLRNCQWPGDGFLHEVSADTWVDQANTCWTGVELNFAAQLYYAGLHEHAEEIIRNVDQRHRKWGIYFDHQEFGGHYFRSMSALAIPNAFLGIRFDGDQLIMAPARPLPLGRWCVLLPNAYGTFFNTPQGGKLVLRKGKIHPKQLEFHFPGSVEIEGFSGEFQKEMNDSKTVFTQTT